MPQCCIHISSDLHLYRKKVEYSEWIRKKPNQSLITFFLAYNWFSNDSTQIKYEGYDIIYMSYHTFVPSYYRIYQREYLRGVYRTHQLELVQLLKVDYNLESWNYHFRLRNNGEKRSRFFYFEIHQAPSEIPANLPGQFSLSGQIFFLLGSSNFEGAWWISK